MPLVIRAVQMEIFEQTHQKRLVNGMIEYGRQLFPKARNRGSLAHSALTHSRQRGFTPRSRDLYYAMCLAANCDILSRGPKWMIAMLNDSRVSDPNERVSRLHAEMLSRIRRAADSERARTEFEQSA